MRFPKRIESIQELIGSGGAEWGIVIEEGISFGSLIRFLCLGLIITTPFYKVYGVSYVFFWRHSDFRFTRSELVIHRELSISG